MGKGQHRNLKTDMMMMFKSEESMQNLILLEMINTLGSNKVLVSEKSYRFLLKNVKFSVVECLLWVYWGKMIVLWIGWTVFWLNRWPHYGGDWIIISRISRDDTNNVPELDDLTIARAKMGNSSAPLYSMWAMIELGPLLVTQFIEDYVMDN